MFYFRVHRNCYRPTELKKNYRGGLPAYQKCRPVWLSDQEKLLVEIVYNG